MRRQGAAGLKHVVHHQTTGLRLEQQRQLQPVAQGHRQHQPAAGDAMDAAEGAIANQLGDPLHGLVEIVPAEVAHRRQLQRPILGLTGP